MTFLSRLLGKPKPPPAVDVERLEQAVAEPSEARPVRAQVYREAFVIYESGYRRKGVVLDHSDTGLRVRFPTNERLPDVLSVSARSVGLEGPAEVIWQKGSEAGLKLI